MLNKELLLQQFVSGWRKLTVGEYRWNDVRGYGFSSNIYNPNSIAYGNLSDRFLNGKTIAMLNSYKSSGTYTNVIFSNYESLPERTLYLKREDKETIALTYETGEGIKYIKYGVLYFTEDDVGKTIDIYLGTTPPPPKIQGKTLRKKAQKGLRILRIAPSNLSIFEEVA